MRQRVGESDSDDAVEVVNVDDESEVVGEMSVELHQRETLSAAKTR